MQHRTDPLPRAAYAWADAAETLDHEHRSCPTVTLMVQRWTGPDGRSVTVVTDRPTCVAAEMELRGGCELTDPAPADVAALAVSCSDNLGGLSW